MPAKEQEIKTTTTNMDIEQITAADVEKMNSAQLISFFNANPPLELRIRISRQFYSETDEKKHREATDAAKRVAEQKGFSFRKIEVFDVNQIKNTVFFAAIPYYIDRNCLDGKTFLECFNLFAKCSEKHCPHPATHYFYMLYRLSGGKKGSWKTTVRTKQYCDKCLAKTLKDLNK